jgi:hypothetical protein
MRADLQPNSHAARLQFSVLEPCLCKVRLPLLWRHGDIDIEKDDVFLLATDGVYEHISNRFAAKTIHEHPQDLDEAAGIIVEAALRQRSQDNRNAVLEIHYCHSGVRHCRPARHAAPSALILEGMSFHRCVPDAVQRGTLRRRAGTHHSARGPRISCASRRRSGARQSIRGTQPLTRAQPPTLQASSVTLTPIGCGASPSPGFM